jgi:hypothetical protein
MITITIVTTSFPCLGVGTDPVLGSGQGQGTASFSLTASREEEEVVRSAVRVMCHLLDCVLCVVCCVLCVVCCVSCVVCCVLFSLSAFVLCTAHRVISLL